MTVPLNDDGMVDMDAVPDDEVDLDVAALGTVPEPPPELWSRIMSTVAEHQSLPPEASSELVPLPGMTPDVDVVEGFEADLEQPDYGHDDPEADAGYEDHGLVTDPSVDYPDDHDGYDVSDEYGTDFLDG